MSGMNLVELEPNLFEDVDTKTTFQFWFGYELTMKEADRRIYAHYRWWNEAMKTVKPNQKVNREFFGRHHVIVQTVDVSGLPGFRESDS